MWVYSSLGRLALLARSAPSAPRAKRNVRRGHTFVNNATKRAPTLPGGPCKSLLFPPFPACKIACPETMPNPQKAHPKMKISLSSIDPCPPFRAKRQSKGGNALAPEKWPHFYISEPPSRAWSRMTGVGNSLNQPRPSTEC